MGRNTKRKKNYYLAPSKRHRLDSLPGTIGFLGTCNTHEDVCVREGYSLLNHYADTLYGQEVIEKDRLDGKSKQSADDANKASPVLDEESSDEEDVDAALKKEVSSLQKSANKSEGRTPRRFQAMRCGTSNTVFFQTTLTDPLHTLIAAMDDILSSGLQRTRHLVRMLPVHVVCKAYLDKIEKALTTFCTDRFKGHTKTFYAVVKVTSNSSLKKEEVLSSVLQVMQQVAPECRPVLTKDADVAVVVNVLVTNCYIGEAPLYLDKYKKYNLVELASPMSNVGKENNAVVVSKDSAVVATKSEVNTAADGVVTESEDAKQSDESLVTTTESQTKDTDVTIPSIDKNSKDCDSTKGTEEVVSLTSDKPKTVNSND